jgi:cytochrome c biogenesis protein ResB
MPWSGGGVGRQKPLGALARFLRTPRVIIAELLLVVAAGLGLATVPQDPSPREAARFALEHPLADPAVRALGLDRIATSPWFAALLLLCGASLAVVATDQWRRAVRVWRAPLTVESFTAAPFRATFERPARAGCGGAVFRPGPRIALLGSPLFHSGLLALIVAGFLRMLLHQDAVARLVESQPLPAREDAWGLQRSGPLARPLRLERPLVVDALEIERHPSGAVRWLSARCRHGDEAFVVTASDPHDLGGTRIFLQNGAFGPAAMLEIGTDTGARGYRVDLEDAGGEVWEGSWSGPDGLRLSLRQRAPAPGALPSELEVRAERRGRLAFVGALAPGAAFAEGDTRVRFLGTAWWVQLAARRDPALPLAYAGIATVLVGALLLVAVNKVDTAVVVTPTPGGERVMVALRAQRFAPAYAERFQALVRAEGGGGDAS